MQWHGVPRAIGRSTNGEPPGMSPPMENLTDDRGYSQIWPDTDATRVRADRRCDMLIEQAQVKTGERVLEIGCGLGTKAHRIAVTTGAQVLATDLCAPFIEQAKARYQAPNLRYEVLDFNRPDQLAGRTFDVVLGDGILHHLYYRLDEALATLRSLLTPDGRLVFIEPNLENPYVLAIFKVPRLRTLTKLEPDEMAFSARFAVQALRKAGLRDVKATYRDFLLPGIPSGLVGPSIAVGAVVEKLPGLRHLSQSILVQGTR